MTKMGRGLLVSLIGVGALMQGCAADDGTVRAGEGTVAAHPSDVDHPGWKLHPDTILLESVDPSAIYDIRVFPDSLRLTRRGHEELIAAIVPGRSVLTARGNEDDVERNDGFVRGIVSLSDDGDEVVMTTKALTVIDIISGYLPFSGVSQPRFIRPGAREAAKIGGASLQSGKAGPARGDVVLTLLDSENKVNLPSLSLGVSNFPLAAPVTGGKPGPVKLAVAASMKASLETKMFLEVGLTGGIDVRWDSKGGICQSFGFLGEACTGAPSVKGEATLSTSYDFAMKPTFEFNGTVGASVKLPEVGIPGVCVIPPGIPCFIKAGLNGSINANLNGTLKFTTDKAFRIYGRSDFGGTFENTNIRLKNTDGPKFEVPTTIEPAMPNPALNLREVGHFPETTIETSADASVEYGPFVKFGLGVVDAANVNVAATLHYKFGATAAICYNVSPVGLAPITTGVGFGATLKRGPEVRVSMGVEAGPFTPNVGSTLFSSYEAFKSVGTESCGGVKADH